MPFKTKKKKLKAAGRRFAFDEGVVRIIDEGRKITGIEVKKEPQAGVENLSYIRGDLLRIIVTSVFIGGAQILLRLTLSK